MVIKDDEDEKPLDPALIAVQARMRRLMLIAGLTLGIGIAAVFLAILYRIVSDDDSPATPPAATVIPGAVSAPATMTTVSRAAAGLSADARLVGTALDGTRALLTFEDGSGLVLIGIDTATGALLSRTRLD